MLGLVLLNTASEELACPRDDFVAARKHELLRLMLLEVPAIFAVLNGQFSDIISLCRHFCLSYKLYMLFNKC